MGSSIIQSRSWHEDSGSNEPEQQDATLASSGVKIPVNVRMSASMGSSIIQSRSWHEYSGSNEPEQWYNPLKHKTTEKCTYENIFSKRQSLVGYLVR